MQPERVFTIADISTTHTYTSVVVQGSMQGKHYRAAAAHVHQAGPILGCKSQPPRCASNLRGDFLHTQEGKGCFPLKTANCGNNSPRLVTCSMSKSLQIDVFKVWVSTDFGCAFATTTVGAFATDH